jgi:hypothetical protein
MSSEGLYEEAKELMRSAGFELSSEEESFLKSAARWPNVWAQTISTLYSSKLLERSNRELAESNGEQASKMRRLTIALLVFAGVEAVATAVSAIGCLR